MKGFDVIVVGAGAIGLVAARALATRGATVLVLDDADPNIRANWSNPGRVDSSGGGHDWPDDMALVKRSLRDWPKFATRLEVDSGLSIGFRSQGSVWPLLEGETAGHTAPDVSPESPVTLLDRSSLSEILGDLPLGSAVIGGLFRAADGLVDVGAFCRALLTTFLSDGGQYLADQRVVAVHQDGTGFRVQSWSQSHYGSRVLLAAGTGNVGLARRLAVDPPLVLETGHMVVTEPHDSILELSVGPIVQRPGGEFLIGPIFGYSGLNPKVDIAGATALAQRARALLPSIGLLKIRELCASVQVRSRDNLPMITGSLGYPNLFMINCGQAITLAAAYDTLLPDWILGDEIPGTLMPFLASRFGDQAGGADPAFGTFDREAALQDLGS